MVAARVSTKVTTTVLMAASTEPPKTLKPPRKGYVPKWKKKATLEELTGGTTDLTKKGLKGDIPVIFKQGNETKTTKAFAGQPVRDVAIQAGQFIKYGCGKGECGTCECLVDGQWIRPCQAVVPPMPVGQDYIIQVKVVKSKAVSSGKFYTAKSMVLGFWNNLWWALLRLDAMQSETGLKDKNMKNLFESKLWRRSKPGC